MGDAGPALRPSSPREVAIRILAPRFGAAATDGGRRVFDLARFQDDAAARAAAVLAARRGVIIADGVGLGKTFVALALIERALRDGERVAVSSPAALGANWLPALRRLARELGVRDTFGIRAGRGRRCARAPALAWFSHTRLSRGTHRPERIGPVGLVVIDEAHAFRNPRTRRYRALAALCVDARVVMLTATPVNNSPMDLYALLRLFASDGAFRDVGVPNLRDAFRAAAGDLTADRRGPDGDRHTSVPPSLVPVLREVVIRRTRSFLRTCYGGIDVPARRGGSPRVLRFPRRAPPVPVRYASDALFRRDGGALGLVDALTFAPFRWSEYAAAATGRTGIVRPELLRLILLKRLESSAAALRSSVRRQLGFHRAFLRALDAGRLLAPADFGALVHTGDDGDAVQLVLDELALRPIPAGLAVGRLAESVRRDAERLRRLHALLKAVTPAADPKLARLRAVLSDDVGGARVVIFTEFRATARYLWHALRHERAVALVDGAGARLGARRCGRRTAIARFAPRANGAREPHPRERVDTLIATDVLAEGLDLHDASRVVSYDLPWNPVRLIQRVGRVDRLGSEHAVVHSYHFLPADGLERFLRLVARLRRKLAAIGGTVGGEAVLAAGPTDPDGFDAFVDRLAAGDPDALDAVERQGARPFEAEERLFAAYRRAVRSTRSPPARPLPVPASSGTPVAVVPVEPGESPRILVAVAVAGTVATIVCRRANGRLVCDRQDATDILSRALDATRPARACIATAEVRRAIAAASRHAIRSAAAARTAEPVSSRSHAARAARCLLGAFAAVPGDPDPGLSGRIDRLVGWLASGQAAGIERAIAEVLDGRGDPPASAGLEALVEQLEALRRRAASEPGRARTGRAPRETGIGGAVARSGTRVEAVVVGVLHLRPTTPGDPHRVATRAGTRAG